jgi:hypothetical protein
MGINSKYVISFKIFPCSHAMQSDILTWKMFLENFNGFSNILDDSWVSNLVLKLFTDSAGGVSKGCGIYFAGKWVH